MKQGIDELLKSVLVPEEEAGEYLKQKILEQVKEKENMKHKGFKGAVAAAAVALTAVSSLTAFAAWQYRGASQVAEELGDEGLSHIFAEQVLKDGWSSNGGDEAGKDDIKGAPQPFETGESQSFGGYKAVLLGMVSGENLSQYQRMSDGVIRGDRTYLAVAVSREDGSPIDDEREDFFVSPLIGSLNPKDHNMLYWGGNYGQYVEDGILYRLMECDNIECFADQSLYVCVTDTLFYEGDLYHWDEAAGEIVRNDGYEGLNALFKLQLDPAKADPEKAKAFLDNLKASAAAEENSVPEDDPYSMLPEEARKAMEWGAQITPENIGQYCVRLEHTVQTKTPDEDGHIFFEWKIDESVSDTAGSRTDFDVEWFFGNGERTMSIGYGASERGMEDLTFDTFTLNADGTVTFAVWVPKEGSRWLK